MYAWKSSTFALFLSIFLSGVPSLSYGAQDDSDEVRLLSNCGTLPDFSKTEIKQIKTRSHSEDVSSSIDIFEKSAKACSFDLARAGFTPSLSKRLRTEGYQSALNKATEALDDENEKDNLDQNIANFRKYSRFLGNDSGANQKKILEVRTRLEKITEQEKAKCTPTVDLRNDALGPVRNQDTVGWCYAFAAADLLTYKTGRKISAADVALNYNDTVLDKIKRGLGKSEKDIQSGYIDEAFNKTVKNGLCLESKLPSEDNGYADLAHTLSDIDAIKRKSKNDAKTKTESAPFCAVSAMFREIKTNQYLDIAEHSTRAELIQNLRKADCNPRITGEKLKAKDRYSRNKESLIEGIDEQLLKKDIVGINYDVSYLGDIHHQGGSLPHGSLIVGRRFNSKVGQCEYLVRNSWGRTCSGYDRRLSCEEGNIWLPTSTLKKAIHGITTVE